MSVSESDKECPLCMEALDWDDLGFFPCSCGYQICRFCWHRLRTDENGLCPACRQAFPDMPVQFNPEISAEELKKQKKRNKEKRSNKDHVFKPQDLATLRVVQKNLVFVIGLSSRLTQEDLKKEFAHFGKIIKFVHNKSTAYITYAKPEEAIRAIRTLNASAAHESAAQHLQFQSQLSYGTSATMPNPLSITAATSNNLGAVTNNQTTNTTTTTTTLSIAANNIATTNGTILNNSVMSLNAANANSFLNPMSVSVPPNRLKASLGTTKYCNHFLRSQQCPKVGECMYLHEIAEAEASFTKEQMQAGKHVEYEKKLMDAYLTKMEWQSNQLASQNNGYRVSRESLPGPQPPQQPQTPSQITTQIQPLIQTQIQSQLQTQLQTPPQQQSQHNQTLAHQLNNIESNCQTHSLSLAPKLSPPQQLQQQQQQQQQLQQQHQMLEQSQPDTLHSRQHQESQSTTIHSRPLQQIESQQTNSLHSRSPPEQAMQQQQHLAIDSDSEDDGLDFDPISVSASGLRDLLDQQVQQAKQLQMLNYIYYYNNYNN